MGAIMNFKTQPKVYVGTYKKYNEGSLNGAWLTLTDYNDYDAFCEACQELHKDEGDPEIMIQDCMDMPDGLSVMECISKNEFDDIIEACKEVSNEIPKFQIIDYSDRAIAVIGETKELKEELKKLGGSFNPRLSCGAGWIFSKKKRNDIEALLKCGIQQVSDTRESKDDGKLWKKYLAEFVSDKRDADYYNKHYIGAVKINDGYLLIGKPSIETKFCFADEGPEYEYYNELMRDESKLKAYFVADNLDAIDRKLEYLKNGTPMVIKNYKNSNEISYCRAGSDWPSSTDMPMTDEQRKDIIDAYQWSRDLFEKRLQSYLKRYGLSKLHIWTYWRDA